MSTAPANPNQALREMGDFTRIAAMMRESGKEAHLQAGLEALFTAQHQAKTGTSIPATFLRVEVTRGA
jgi:hypothetical protein